MGGSATPAVEVRVVSEVRPPEAGGLYPHNRAPLAPSPFFKLPIGSIQPQGWLRHMLELERDGMTGRLKEVSPWLDFSKSSWADKTGGGKFGWEEMPYWLKGYGDLGYVLKDEAIIAETKKWIDAAMASQREDGWFGPRELLTSLKGKPDLWPHMVMLNVLQSYHEYTQDPRAIEVITRYLKWLNQLPVSAFGEGYWPKLRWGDNLETCYWLYNRTSEPWLLELAAKIHQGMARWDEAVVNWHNVNIAQGFRAGTVFWMQSQNPAHLASAERNYRHVMDLYGQFPGGGFVGDENSRPGYSDPRGGIETCGIVEFMHSFQMLMRVTGDPLWIDRCEEIAFNSFPASMTPDQKGLHYVTCANQVQLDRHNKSPGIENTGTMFSYSPFEVYRCCQHNVSHGWPYYAEELWLATHDGGLCASLYSSSEVTAKVGDGTPVTISEQTGYPFAGTVRFKVTAAAPVRFPLYLRVPGWCEEPKVRLNGKRLKVQATPRSFVVIERDWKSGDTVELQLPMRLAVRTWAKNQNAASVDYGPLSFSLAIEEKWQRYGNRHPDWPEWEVYAASPWNYGLVLDPKDPTKGIKVKHRKGAVPEQPWTAASAPITLRAKARKIPNWTTDGLNMVGKLQPSPVRSGAPVEPITLIPMGAARLRIAMFPVAGNGEAAREWTQPALSASHVFAHDSLEALTDGQVPDAQAGFKPRFTWWDRRGTREWVEWNFTQPRTISSTQIHWYDDLPAGGGCAVPQSWRLLARVNGQWVPVQAAGGFGTETGVFNKVTFEPVTCTALRIEAQLKPERSSGILEWRVGE
ncbi:MAG TPA: beta-L-arabinofuranosidase domain-containing protein [Clostridia bacterium]|nr:beta-L-arabinofuranosidase domain-containing protein [Clostridia bacterium]